MNKFLYTIAEVYGNPNPVVRFIVWFLSVWIAFYALEATANAFLGLATVNSQVIASWPVFVVIGLLCTWELRLVMPALEPSDELLYSDEPQLPHDND